MFMLGKMAELAQAIVTFELGSAVDAADHYNIREVYSAADQYTPVVFMLPTELQGPAWDATHGQPYVSPVHEVKRLAREVGMEGKVRVMNFGVRSQGSEVRQALDDCIHSGNWLLLQNYHLADDPDPTFFFMLKVSLHVLDLVYARWVEEDLRRETSEVSEEDHSLVTRSRPSTHLQHHRIHPTFRLWITTRADGQRIIPGILIQHGMRVTCEATANFRSTLQKAYRSTAFLLNKWRPADEEVLKKMPDPSVCRMILSDMVQVTGAPELLLQVRLTASVVVVEPHVVVGQLLGALAACPRLPRTDSQQIMPLDHFLHTELAGYRTLLEQTHAKRCFKDVSDIMLNFEVGEGNEKVETCLLQ
nr:hypothetical protein BaRGS_029261 [Batillaria attramentaria]